MRFGMRLFSLFSFLLLSAAALYCLAMLSGFVLPKSNETISYSEPSIKSETASKPASSISTNTSTSSIPTASSSESVAASAKGKAKGKIINRTILPENGNLKFQKISVKNNTSLTLDLKAELLTGPKLRLKDTKEPQVLIVHTHTTECFMNEERDYYTDTDKTRTTKESENIVAVGSVLKETLTKHGIGVVHATEQHDYPEYTGSYSRSAATIKKYLSKYPTISVVIDLHRDSITSKDGTKSAVVAEVDGKKAAQVMLVAGCEDGSVTGFPNWRENFRLAIRLQQSLEVMYPSLARPIYFTERKYNQNLTTGSLLLECGTEANTLEQAKYSAKLVGNALASTLQLLK